MCVCVLRWTTSVPHLINYISLLPSRSPRSAKSGHDICVEFFWLREWERSLTHPGTLSAFIRCEDTKIEASEQTEADDGKRRK